jgi:signal transduction histidine kinase/ligand-binding sensor domain-containing protein/DNA-binding NarL/FixJ family response regulator
MQDSPLARVSDFGRPAIRVFTDATGLPQNSVQALAYDARGHLWIGTQDGAAVYNGRAWTVVPMPSRTRSNFVRTLLAGSDAKLYFGTIGGGLSLLSDGRWTEFNSSTVLPDDDVRCLLETHVARRPVLWVGTLKGGLARFDGRHWAVFDTNSGLPSNAVVSLVETVEPNGNQLLWAGTLLGGLACFDGATWSAYDVAPDRSRSNNVLSLMEHTEEDGTRVLWIGCVDGVLRFDLNCREFVAPLPGVPNSGVFSLCRTRTRPGKHILWAGTATSSLMRFEGDRFRSYDSESGLPNAKVYSLLDASGRSRPEAIWVGTDGGLAHIDETGWWRLKEDSSLPNKTAWSFANLRMPNGVESLAVGTDGGGVAVLGPDGWTVHDTESGLPNDVVWHMVESRSTEQVPILCAGTELGLASLVDGRWEVLDQASGLADNRIQALLETVDAEGTPTLWIGTILGITRIENGRITHLDRTEGMPLEDIWRLLETVSEDGTRSLWAGSRVGGLGCLRNGHWTVYDTSSGLPNNSVFGLQETSSADGKRTLWVGTLGGGVAFRDLSSPNAPWTVLDDTTTPALPNNSVYQIQQDRQGRVYLTTNKGVARLTPRAPTPDDPAEFSIYTFTTEDGLPSNECNAGASLVDRLGRIWVGTAEGVAFFDPSREVEDRTPKPLVIERVALNGVETALSGRGPLAHDENNLEFEYALLSFFRESDTRYQTQLVGFDRAPSDWTADYRRNYTNLPAGDYEFRVWGRDAFGNVSGPERIAFRIKPAPWKTRWAYLLYGVGATAAVAGSVRYRLGSLRRRSEELETIVEQRTEQLAATAEQLRLSEQRALEASRAKSDFLSNMSHELRTPLNAVIGLARLMERDRSLGAEQRETLNIIHDSGEHLLGLIDDVLSISKIEAGKIELAPHAFDLRHLLRVVEEITRVRAHAKNLDLTFALDPSLPDAVWGDEGKLRQVLINLLGNAVKFTDEGGITLRARWRDGRAAFEVEDTGRGIADDDLGKLFEAFTQLERGERAQEGTGLGLVISRQIVRLMEGDISVRSQFGEGTTFACEIELPLANDAPAGEIERRVVGLAQGQEILRVLVADDGSENRLLLTRLLAAVGFDVREAADGAQATRVWEDWHPHLIWMDVQMPVMDGLDATRAIRRAESKAGDKGEGVEAIAASGTARGDVRHCVIIALTASAFEHQRAAILESGADDLVTKPYTEQLIFAKLGEHLGARFLYEEHGTTPRRREDVADVLTPVRVAAAPAELTARVYEALFIGDGDAALRAAEQIGHHDEALGRELVRKIRGFQFADVLSLLRPGEPS